MRNQEDTEDIAQESFIKCYQNLNKFDQKRPFAPWICRIASNLALSRLRQLKKCSFLPWEQVSFQVADLRAADPAEALEENETRRKVADCIKQLNPLDQLVVFLRYYQEFSYDEIAYILQTRRNNVEVRLHRARKKLHQIFAEKEEVKKCSPAGK